jgi:predicted P-loop ATPase
LPAWDGVSRFDELMGKIEMTSPVDGYDLSRIFWRKWFIGSVAKALDGAQNFMLVLLSRQGTGKSTLVSWLCPKRNLFYEGPINPENADDKIRSINHWVWEVAELDSTTRRAEVAALKFFVTQKWLTVRVPYGRYDIRKKAAASYIGTINPDGTGFLQDVENRRFAVVHLDEIDFSYTEIDRDQLWAEIYHAYRAGETHELTRHEREIQNEINAGHVTESPLEGLILEHYDLTADERHELTSTQLLEELEGLGLRGQQFQNKMELGKILARHNVKRGRVMRNGQKQYVYKGIKFRDKGRIVQL